jgi:signal transduction histidine kinase
MGHRHVLGQLGRGGGTRFVVLLGSAGFVVGVYVVVVLGGGALIGHPDSPSVALSVLATAAVALSLAPVQSALGRAASGWGQGDATPYDVLSRFSEEVTGADATEELPARMAMLLARGTGARWAQVWLSVSGRLTLAATWPVDVAPDATAPPRLGEDLDDAGSGRRTLEVRHGGRVLGVLRLQERPGLALTAVEERLFAGLAAQAGLVLSLVGLRAELDDRHEELLLRAEELRASRGRLIDTQDAARSRLERDLHDGAQQHLVALTVNLRLAATIVERSPARAAVVLSQQAAAAVAAIETLSSLSRGIYPSRLAEEGLAAALRLAVSASPVPVTVVTDGVTRPPAAVEAALYFCCMEAVQNAAKHSAAGTVSVRLGEDQHQWRVVVSDDGEGFDPARAASSSGAGLANMRDRLDAVGGTVDVESVVRAGTRVTARVPRTEPRPPAAGTVSTPHRVG